MTVGSPGRRRFWCDSRLSHLCFGLSARPPQQASPVWLAMTGGGDLAALMQVAIYQWW